MFDLSFLIPTIISISALLLSLYRELKGPDISLLSKDLEFKLTDESFSVSDEYTPEWFRLKGVSLVFANYGGKGGTILDVRIDFTPTGTFKEFFQHFSFYPSDLPKTMKEGENFTMKVVPSIRTINWKKFALTKMLQTGQNVEEIVDKAVAEGKEKFERFCSFLSENDELGEVSCTVSLTVGRVRTEVRSKKFFEKIKVKNEYDKTIDLLRKRLQNWDRLQPTKLELMDDFLHPSRSLVSELKKNLSVLENEVNEQNIAQSKLVKSQWDHLSKVRDEDERRIRWFMINKEKDLRENLEGLYKQISNYNDRIQELLYLGENRTKIDFKKLNRERGLLYSDMKRVFNRLKGLIRDLAD